MQKNTIIFLSSIPVFRKEVKEVKEKLRKMNKVDKSGLARYLVAEVMKVSPSATVAHVVKQIGAHRHLFKVLDYIYVVDKNEHLMGVVSLDDLFHHAKNTRLDRIMQRNVVTIDIDTDQEKAAHLALKNGIKAVPVTEKRKLLGVIPAKNILHILNHSLQEDILHFAGIHKAHLEYENTLEVPLYLAIVHRIPWLIIGLFGILLAASMISRFEAILEKNLMLAFFIPVVVYMSSALGTQHQTLFVRDLSLMGKELRLGYYFIRQMAIALFLGIIIGVLAFFIIAYVWGQSYVAFVIALSIVSALLVTSITALLITLLMAKLGGDPALGSGPFATIVSDLTSIFIYFVIAAWLL